MRTREVGVSSRNVDSGTFPHFVSVHVDAYEQVSICLYDRQKIGTATVHFYFISLAGPRDKQLVFAKLGLTPQMDVGHYTAWRTLADFCCQSGDLPT